MGLMMRDTKCVEQLRLFAARRQSATVCFDPDRRTEVGRLSMFYDTVLHNFSLPTFKWLWLLRRFVFADLDVNP